MKKMEKNSEIGFCILVTLIAFPFLVEPLQLPKSIALILFTIILIYKLLFRESEYLNKRKQKLVSFIIIAFIVSIIPPFLKPNLNIYTTIYGSWGRNLGLITYFCFIVFFISSFLNSDKINFKKIQITTIYFTSITVIYGLLQRMNVEILQIFSLEYNINHEVILTLGNTNFASAFLALLGILSLGSIFNFDISRFARILSFVNLVVIFLLVGSMDDLQGKLMLTIGFSLFIVFNFRQIVKFMANFPKNTKIIISLTSLILLAMLSYFGKPYLQNITQSFERGSFRDRVFLWQAALKMIAAKPFTGVGIEDYSANYRKFRSVDSINFRGTANLGSDNAHNLILHLGSTAGILMMFFIIFMFVLILISSMYLFIKSDLKMSFSTIFIFSFGYILQSMISPDNIGISIWFWTYGGFTVGLALQLLNKGSKSAQI